jgi:hypothetical protein
MPNITETQLTFEEGGRSNTRAFKARTPAGGIAQPLGAVSKTQTQPSTEGSMNARSRPSPRGLHILAACSDWRIVAMPHLPIVLSSDG